MSKVLTQAQQDHLQALVDAARNANRAVDMFIEYLRDEYEAPEGAWQIGDIREGFTEAQPASNGAMTEPVPHG